MAKKKKKRLNKFNPHKLGEHELIDQIRSFLNQNQLDNAYKLVKVLLEKFSSEKNTELFRDILSKKLRLLEEKGHGEDIALLLTEAKKRFSIEIFFDADEFNTIRQLSDIELVDHFLTKESIPEFFQHRVADYLFFSKKNEKEFIKHHREFKDVFFIKEAFKNGFHPETSKKLMSGISSNSPYKQWVLLRKGIEAFYDNDSASLEVLKKKITEPTFPRFLLEKLFQAQELLQGKNGKINQISQTDLDVFEALCGENFLRHCIFNRVENICRTQNSRSALSLLKSWSNIIGTEMYIDLFILVLGKCIQPFDFPDQKEAFIINLSQLPEIKAFYLDIDHLIIKFIGRKFLIDSDNGSIFEGVAGSNILDTCDIVPSNVLKAELLYASAQSQDAQMKSSGSPFDFLFGNFKEDNNEKIFLLEESINASPHNPEIFIALINEYNTARTKTSIVNTVIKKMLASFPANPEGYKLAGDIAYKNKTFSKALGFYEKAHELMPLNRDFSLIIIKCYDDIVEKRNSKNIHLIENDLQKAKSYTLNAGKKVLTEFKLLMLKAMIKLVNTSIISREKFVDEVENLAGHFQENNFNTFRFLFLIEDNESGCAFKNGFFENMENNLVKNCSTKIFSEIFPYCLENSSQMGSKTTVFSSVVIGFFRKKKEHPTITMEDLTTWMFLSLKNGWNRLFTALVFFGESVFPDHPIYKFFAEILQTVGHRTPWKKYLFKKETIKWLKADIGLKILDILSSYDYMFEDLHDVIEDERDFLRTEGILEEVKDILNDTSSPPFRTFFKTFIKTSNSLDQTSFETVMEIVGYAPNNSVSTKGSLKSLKKPPIKKKHLEKKKPALEEINEQLDIFSIFDN